MSFSVKSIEVFERQAKKLVKKHPSLIMELSTLVNDLKQEPKQGKPLGKNCFKIRLAIKTKGKGKSGGARITTNIVVIR